MQFSFFLILALVIFAVALAADETPATTQSPAGTCDSKTKPAGISYKDQNSGKGLFGAWSCMNFYECYMGVEVEHHCSYVIPLKQYNPETRSCDWFWNVNCHADDPANA